MFAYINISGGNLIKSYKFDQQHLNMFLNNVQCTLCILICVLIICIFIFSSKSEITPTISPLRGFFLNLSLFAFHAQDEKNQIITTNVWLNLVSHILDVESRAPNDNISFKQVGRVSTFRLAGVTPADIVQWTAQICDHGHMWGAFRPLRGPFWPLRGQNARLRRPPDACGAQAAAPAAQQLDFLDFRCPPESAWFWFKNDGLWNFSYSFI